MNDFSKKQRHMTDHSQSNVMGVFASMVIFYVLLAYIWYWLLFWTIPS